MNLHFLKHKWQRRLTRSLATAIVLILLFSLVINLYWSPILARMVKKMVLSSSDSLYNVNFSDAELHVLQGKIVIFNADLYPDTSVYNRLKKQNLAPNNLYHLHFKRLVLRHIHPFKLYFQKKLDIGEVILSRPQIYATYHRNHTRDTSIQGGRTLYQHIAKTLRYIHVDHIGLNDVNFRYEDYSESKPAVSELKEMNLSATDLMIDSASQTDKSRFLYCRDINIELKNFSGHTLGNLYSYKVNLLTLSTRTAQLNAQGLLLQPLAPDKFFSKSNHDRFTIRIDSMQLNHFDFLSYHKYRTVSGTSLVLNGGSVGVFSKPKLPNKNKHTNKVDKSATFPNAGIFHLKTDMTIDSIFLHHINATYTQFNPKSHKTGSAHFNNTSGLALNLTTNAEKLQKNNICTIAVTSYFMDKGKLDVAFKFNLTDKKLAYSYKGHMGPMNLSSINPAVIPMAMIKISSGTIKSFDFDIHADINHSAGRVTLLYNDLKIKLLKPDTVNDKLQHMTIASLFANIFIIKHNNPDNPGETPRSFLVDYPREPDFPFFKSVWKTLLSGIRSCAGYGDKKEKEVKTQLADRAQKKKERKEKKAERKEKRAEKKLEKQQKKQEKEAAAKG